MTFAERELRRRGRGARAIDLGCGAGRNALPLAESGWHVLGVDLSWPMLESARERRQRASLAGRFDLASGAMDAIPARDGCADLVIAHGIWNLARSADEFRRALTEAGRISRRQAALFVFTFSRRTLPPTVKPIPGETFVFDAFSGEPQCFLTAEQLVSELAAHGFSPDPGVALREHNLPQPGLLPTAGLPVIYEATFRFHDEDDTR